MALLEGALLIAKGFRIQDFSTWQPKRFLNHNDPGKLCIFDHSTNSSKSQQELDIWVSVQQFVARNFI
jgi:hypothetical protein